MQLIFAGGTYIPPQALSREGLAPEKRSTVDVSSNSIVVGSPADLGLTKRQVEVLGLLMDGKSNKLISRALKLAEATVKNHVRAIFKALNVSNRTEAAIAASRFKWESRSAPKP